MGYVLAVCSSPPDDRESSLICHIYKENLDRGPRENYPARG